MAFRKGSEEADKASQYASFQRTHFLKVDDGKSVVVRFITDAPDWIVVDMHQGVPTKARPADYKPDKWPEALPTVCRHDSAFEYEDCFICDVLMRQNPKLKKPSARVWALAVLREAVVGDGSPELGGPENQGKTLGYKDATRTIAKTDADGKPTGEEVEEKAIIVVNQGNKNFFSGLSGFANFHGTVVDRDYVIQRKGIEKATDYNLIPLDPIKLADGRLFDLRDESVLKERYGMTHAEATAMLEGIVTERSSDDYYAMWFDSSKVATGGGSSGAASDASSTSAEPDEAALDALRNRISGYTPGAPEAGAGAAPAVAPVGETVLADSGLRSFD